MTFNVTKIEYFYHFIMPTNTPNQPLPTPKQLSMAGISVKYAAKNG